MKKFRFSLDAVLKWKRLQEEEALKALGQAMQARQRAHERLLAARAQMDKTLASIQQAREGRMSGALQVTYLSEIGRCEALCQQNETLLKEATNTETLVREDYLKKRRATEAISKLRGKREEMYIKASALKKEQELEEIMLSKR